MCAKTPNDNTIRLAQAGDPEAWKNVLKFTSDFVGALLIKRRGINPQDIGDLRHEIVLKVSDGIFGFDERRGRFEKWLKAIARNHLRDHWKEKSRDVKRFIPLPEDECELHALVVSDTAEPMLEMDRETVRNAVGQLPEGERDVLKLRFFKGMTGHEAAEALRVTESVVSTRSHRGRKRLRSTLECYCDE